MTRNDEESLFSLTCHVLSRLLSLSCQSVSQSVIQSSRQIHLIQIMECILMVASFMSRAKRSRWLASPYVYSLSLWLSETESAGTHRPLGICFECPVGVSVLWRWLAVESGLEIISGPDCTARHILEWESTLQPWCLAALPLLCERMCSFCFVLLSQ